MFSLVEHLEIYTCLLKTEAEVHLPHEIDQFEIIYKASAMKMWGAICHGQGKLLQCATKFNADRFLSNYMWFLASTAIKTFNKKHWKAWGFTKLKKGSPKVVKCSLWNQQRWAKYFIDTNSMFITMEPVHCTELTLAWVKLRDDHHHSKSRQNHNSLCH